LKELWSDVGDKNLCPCNGDLPHWQERQLLILNFTTLQPVVFSAKRVNVFCSLAINTCDAEVLNTLKALDSSDWEGLNSAVGLPLADGA